MQKLTQMAQDRRLTQQSQAKGSVLSALQIALPSVVMKRISSTVKPLPHANEEEVSTKSQTLQGHRF